MKYLEKSFSTSYNSKAYTDNWDKIFGKKPKEPYCPKCGGSGWVWWNELRGCAGHDVTQGITDDTKYSCDDCSGSGELTEENSET